MKQEGLGLKDQQVEAVKLLSEGEDVFVWFPTDYGKSICYQLLPFVFDIKLGRTNQGSESNIRAICTLKP